MSRRRLRIDAVDRGRLRPDGMGVTLLQPGTEPWVRRLEESSVLEECEEAAPPPPGLTVTAVLGLEPDGSILNVQILGDITTLPAIKWADCMVQRLPSVALPCRPPGVDRLQVSVTTRSPQ